MYADAFSYPVRGSGWVMILLGTVLSVIMDLMKSAPLFGLIVGVFAMGYFAAFYLDIVNSTMTDHDTVPDWPSITSFLDDIIHPILRILGILLMSFGPLLIYAIFVPEHAPYAWVALVVGVIYGCIYFPMAVLAVQSFGSIVASSPHVVLPGIVRTMPGYALPVVALIVVLVGVSLTEEYATKIPYVGWAFAAAVSLYGLMFQARLIGLIYREKRDHLGWE